MSQEFSIPITRVVRLLRLPLPPDDKVTSYNIKCPMCDEGKKKHLNIDVVANVFRCPICGFGGGVLDFYSYFGRVDRAKAFDKLKEALGTGTHTPGTPQPARHSQPQSRKAKIVQNPVVDIEIRDETYRKLLSMLSLAKDHKADLLRRGLNENAIEANLYRTTPSACHEQFALALKQEGCQLAGVPGFYTKNGTWVYKQSYRGYYVPTLDQNGLIQGLALRHDEDERARHLSRVGEELGKFGWVTSKHKPNGTPTSAWLHVVGGPVKRLIIIEGPLKADIVHHYTGATVIAVPGVSSLGNLKEILLWFKARGALEVEIAYDMDYLKNPNVQKAYKALRKLIREVGLWPTRLLWDPFYNGMDDYVVGVYQSVA